MYLNIDSRLWEIFYYEESTAVFDRFFPGMRERTSGRKASLDFTIRKMVGYTNGAIKEEIMLEFNTELKKLAFPVPEKERVAYTEDWPKTVESMEQIAPQVYDSIHPGQPWYDTDGYRIQAHAGAVFYENGTYYWYGENKDRTDGESEVWTWGIRVYSSTDLYNWKSLGFLIAPDLNNPQAGLYPEMHVDRPHIVKCEATQKYVCWIKQSGEEGCFIILQADAFLGPYELVQENYRPMGMWVGDFDMVVEQESRKAYLFMNADSGPIVGFELTEDYLQIKTKVSIQYGNLHPPFTREGVTLFTHNGKKYMLTSGMTGYTPNKSDCAVSDADCWDAPFVSIGNPHVNDSSNASFNSQISQIFQVAGKEDFYIAIADRWVPDYLMDEEKTDCLERKVASSFEPGKYQVSEEECRVLADMPDLSTTNTSKSDYVWLPVRFKGDIPQIEWSEEWSIS